MEVIIGFVILAASVAGIQLAPCVGLLIAAFVVASIWQARLNARHNAASACGTSGGNPKTLFGTAFWVVFVTITLCAPTIYLLAPAAFFIKTH